MFKAQFKKDSNTSSTGFRYRGKEGSRLESLTDGVFAFAITLLVIATEVPATYVELQASMYGFFGFIACIFLILGIWSNHANFFLYYGLQNEVIKRLNFLFLFVLLFYIYPLKYLFSFLGSVISIQFLKGFGFKSEAMNRAIEKAVQADLNVSEWEDLMIRFGIGMILIYGILAIMHYIAIRNKEALELTDREAFETKTFIRSYLALVFISLLSIFIVLIFGGRYAPLSGCSYLLVPIFLILIKKKREKKMNSLYPLIV